MRKTSIVVALCLVLIGTLTATVGVAAAPTDDSAIQRFDIGIGDYKYGELTVEQLTWIHAYGDGAVFFVRSNY